MRVGGHWGALSMVLLFATNAAAAPERSGFTGDLGIGAAWTSVPVTRVTASFGPSGSSNTTETTRETSFGLAPLSLSLGGYLSPRVALLFRMAGTSYLEDDTQWANNFYGAIVEVWPHDRFYVSGGCGFGIFGPNPFVSNTNVESEAGFALDFRAGAALINGRSHDVTLSLEVIPGFYEDGSVLGYAIVGAWKWY